MIDAPAWFVWGFDFLFFAIILIVLWLLKAWWNVKKFKGKNTMKMYAEIEEPSGRRVRHLVEPDPTGATVTVDNKVYALPKETSKDKIAKLKETGIHIVPDRHWIDVPNPPLPPIPVRIESWDYDNPEPKRAFYGRVDENGKFVESQLTVTSTEWNAQKGVMQASQLAMRIQMIEALVNQVQKLITNIPNKIIVYLLAGAAAIFSAIVLFIVYQMAGM